jgi:hypothetical protein
MAGGFANPRLVREALVAVSTRLRSRTREIITADDRLLLTTSLAIDALEREAKRLRASSNNQLELVAALLHLVAHLLGYDWMRGAPNRQVVFFQTLEQQLADDRLSGSASYGEESMAEFKKRLEVVTGLYDDGLRPAQIARVLLMSEQLIKQLLIRSGKLHHGTPEKPKSGLTPG